MNSTGYAFQVELTTAKTAQQIDIQGTVPGAENPQTSAVAIKALSGNAGPLFIGFSKGEVEKEEKISGAGFEIVAGESIAIDIQNLGLLWFNGANAKDKLCVLGVGP